MPAISLFFALIASAGESAATSSIHLPDWMTLSARRANQEQVDDLFHSRNVGGGGPSWAKESFYDLHEPAGYDAIRWYFVRPGNSLDPPTAAIRFELSDRIPYRVHVQVYCSELRCAGLMEGLARMPPPAPGRGADEKLRTDWLRTISTEPCRRGTIGFQPARYPAEESRRQIGGKVELRLVANSCGEIRGATTTKSSGNRHLDRAARLQALTWRLPRPSEPGGSRFWATSVTFEAASDPASKDESVVNGEFTAVTSMDP